MYDLPYEMQYELYSDMGKHFYWGSYTIAVKDYFGYLRLFLGIFEFFLNILGILGYFWVY